MSSNNEELLILWTTNNVGTSVNMILMYAENAKIQGWWSDVTVLIWGSSSKLVSEDQEIQKHIQVLLQNNVRVVACKQCAENYDILNQLEGQGIEVFYTGQFLTDWIKSGKKLITI